MSTIFKENIVPLYINSADRINIDDSTTDFTINLRKSLRNISSINISNVVIPNAETTINANNNVLTGFILIDSARTEQFDVVLTNNNYTEATLATELQDQLNANTVLVAAGFTWTAAYNPSTRVIDIVLTYLAGGSISSWGIEFLYTPLVDVIGIGDASTTSRIFETSMNDTLPIITGRSPNIDGTLYYNVTSKALSDSIDTSYIQSLGKSFNIEAPDNTIIVNTTQEIVTEEEYLVPVGGGSQSAILDGSDVSISGDGNIIASTAQLAGVSVYTRIDVNGSWVQRVDTFIPDNFTAVIVTGVSLSSDGNTLAIVDSSFVVGSDFVGKIHIYNKVGFEWVESATLVPAGYIGNVGVTSTGLSADGNVLVVGGVSDNGNIGANWVFTRVSGTWDAGVKLIAPASFLFQGRRVDISHDGTRFITSAGVFGDAGEVWVFTDSGGGSWDAGVSLIGLGTSPGRMGVSLTISGDGLRVGFGGFDVGSFADGTAWVFTDSGGGSWDAGVQVAAGGTPSITQGTSVSLNYDGTVFASGDVGGGNMYIFKYGGSWTDDATLVAENPIGFSNFGNACSLSNDGSLLAVGGQFDDSEKGASWIFEDDSGWDTGIKIISSSTATPIQQGRGLKISHDGNIMVSHGRDTVSGMVFVYDRPISSTYWNDPYKLLPPADAIGQGPAFGERIGLTNDGGVMVLSDISDDSFTGALWVYTNVNGSLVDSVVKLTIPSLPTGAQFGSGVDITPDGTMIVASIFNNGGIGVFTDTSGVWTSEIVDPSIIGVSDVSISDDGSIIAGGNPSVDLSNGAAWVWTNTNGVWGSGIKLVGIGNTGAAGQGGNVKLSSDGTVLVVSGAANNSDEGAVWVWRYSGSWVQEQILIGTGFPDATIQGDTIDINPEGTKILISGNLYSGWVIWTWAYDGTWTQVSTYQNTATPHQINTISATADMTEYVTGDTSYNLNTGQVFFHTTGGTYENQYTVTIPARIYSIFDLTQTLEPLLILDPLIKLVPTFDNVNIMTLTMVDSGNTISPAVFNIDPLSTFEFIRWPETEPLGVQISAPIDMTINNDVLKSVLNYPASLAGNIIDTRESQIFRKYQAGFTIEADTPIDIVLRDERDRIVDLNGLNWVMAIFVRIQT
jgi:hypothetical protein